MKRVICQRPSLLRPKMSSGSAKGQEATLLFDHHFGADAEFRPSRKCQG
jgi:hypothetical protein